MRGSATLTTVPSSAAMPLPRIVAVSTPRPCAERSTRPGDTATELPASSTPRRYWLRTSRQLEFVDLGGVAGQDEVGRRGVRAERGDGAGVGGDARDARPVGAEDHPAGEAPPVVPGVVRLQARGRQAGQLD